MNAFFKYTSRIALSTCLALGLTFCSDDDSSAGSGTTVTVELAVVVSGQLTDSNTGDPLANATLDVSNSLAVKSGADRTVDLVTTTTTDANGFYELILEAGAFTHTINITDSDGNDLGSIDLTITEESTVESLDSSNAPSITASIPVVEEVEDEPVAAAALDLAGTYDDTEVTTGGQATGSKISNTVINDDNQVIFGSIRGSYFSADGTKLSIPLGSGTTLGAICTQDGETVECVTGSVEIGGTTYDSIELSLTRNSTNTTIPDGSAEIEDLLTMSGFNDGFLSTEWNGTPTEVYDDDNADKADSTPGAEIDKIYVGDYTGSSDFIAVFVELAENVDRETDYRFTLKNDTYSEIMINLYDPDGDSGGETFTMAHRINDDEHTDMGGTQGIDWDFNASNMNSESTTNIEFWFKLSTLTNGTVEAANMTGMELSFETSGSEDETSDVAYPFETYDFFQ